MISSTPITRIFTLGLIFRLMFLMIFFGGDLSFAGTNLDVGPYEAEPECSSWVSVGEASEDGRTILHKNRDKQRGAEVVIYRKPSGKNAYLAVCHNVNRNDVGAGINQYGLAVTCNVVSGINILGSLAPVNMNREILENCGSVETAYAYIKQNRHRAYNEAIYFIADGAKAAVVECHSRFFGMDVLPLEDCLIDGKNGRPRFAGRSNRFEQYKNLIFDLSDHNNRRYERINRYLTQHEGSFSPLESFWLARDHYYPDGAGFVYAASTGAVCNQPKNGTTGLSTISAVTFTLDPQYPELSTMWVALGAPDSTFFVPIHVSVMQAAAPAAALPVKWTTSTAYDLAETIRLMGWWKEPYLDATRHYLAGVEAKLLSEEVLIRENARREIAAGRKAGAYEMLRAYDAQAALIISKTLDLIVQTASMAARVSS